MIPVVPQPEPAGFDRDVRVPGNAWLAAKSVNLTAPLPTGIHPHPYWRKCLADLHSGYGGVCAYLAVHVERATGVATADHLVAKSANAALTYEWSNYRLACLAMNARKRAFDDVLDPFAMPADVFRLELVSGRIFLNPSLPGALASEAGATLLRLKLDSAINRGLRAAYYQYYVDAEISAAHLKRMSPFVWSEANRQGLL